MANVSIRINIFAARQLCRISIVTKHCIKKQKQQNICWQTIYAEQLYWFTKQLLWNSCANVVGIWLVLLAVAQ